MSNLSNRLKECIQEHGVTQSALAKATGIERSNISEFISEKHTPSYTNFIALLCYFNCSADYMLGLTDIHTEEPLHQPPAFATRLRTLLKEQGLTQTAVIENLPVSASVLYKWLSGKSLPSTDTLIRLATFFDCSVDYLIGRIQ